MRSCDVLNSGWLMFNGRCVGKKQVASGKREYLSERRRAENEGV
jgi:hypothetical protein